jgi:hypothetical protein
LFDVLDVGHRLRHRDYDIVDHVDQRAHQEPVELFQVASPNALACPGAVVVHLQDAHFAINAMDSTRKLTKLANFTVPVV